MLYHACSWLAQRHCSGKPRVEAHAPSPDAQPQLKRATWPSLAKSEGAHSQGCFPGSGFTGKKRDTKGERRVGRERTPGCAARSASPRPSGAPRADASGAARVLAGGASRSQSGRASGKGRGLRAPAPRVLLFCTHTNTKSHTTFGYPFSIFFSPSSCVCFQIFLKIEICGSAGVRKLLLRGICSFPHFFFCLSFSFFFLVKV